MSKESEIDTRKLNKVAFLALKPLESHLTP